MQRNYISSKFVHDNHYLFKRTKTFFKDEKINQPNSINAQMIQTGG